MLQQRGWKQRRGAELQLISQQEQQEEVQKILWMVKVAGVSPMSTLDFGGWGWGSKEDTPLKIKHKGLILWVAGWMQQERVHHPKNWVWMLNFVSGGDGGNGRVSTTAKIEPRCLISQVVGMAPVGGNPALKSSPDTWFCKWWRWRQQERVHTPKLLHFAGGGGGGGKRELSFGLTCRCVVVALVEFWGWPCCDVLKSLLVGIGSDLLWWWALYRDQNFLWKRIAI